MSVAGCETNMRNGSASVQLGLDLNHFPTRCIIISRPGSNQFNTKRNSKAFREDQSSFRCCKIMAIQYTMSIVSALAVTRLRKRC